MKRYELIAGLLVFLATIGTFLGVFGIEKYRRSKFYTIELLARQTNAAPSPSPRPFCSEG